MNRKQPWEVYSLALKAIAAIPSKYAVDDELYFARILTAQSHVESTHDADAKAKGSTALGLMQVLKGTQKAIEKMMKWPAKSSDARKDPLYAMQLGAAYMAYHYTRNKRDWSKALSAYNQGHCCNASGNSYARTVLARMKQFDFDKIAQQARGQSKDVADLEWYLRPEFR